MFLDVFSETSMRNPLLLYDKEGKPVGRKINSSKLPTFSKNFPEIRQKCVPPVVYYKYQEYRGFKRSRGKQWNI